MLGVRSAALSVLCLALSASSIRAQDLSWYRGFELGMTLAAVAQQARLAPGAARVLHERPQMIQELDWLPQLQPRPGAAAPEAVRIVRFTFYDGRLYRIIVSYDRDRVEGLTAEDFVQAVSTTYGRAILGSTQIGTMPRPVVEDLSLGLDRVVAAQWEDLLYTVSLVHTSYPSAFEVVLLARQPDQLARVATLASTELDRLEAPQVEATRRQQQADQDRLKAEKARGVNKLAFRF